MRRFRSVAAVATALTLISACGSDGGAEVRDLNETDASESSSASEPSEGDASESSSASEPSEGDASESSSASEPSGTDAGTDTDTDTDTGLTGSGLADDFSNICDLIPLDLITFDVAPTPSPVTGAIAYGANCNYDVADGSEAPRIRLGVADLGGDAAPGITAVEILQGNFDGYDANGGNPTDLPPGDNRIDRAFSYSIGSDSGVEVAAGDFSISISAEGGSFDPPYVTLISTVLDNLG